jgi:hypothetical protein
MLRSAGKIPVLFLLIITYSARICAAQDQPPAPGPGTAGWDFGVWIAGETGEELTNSITDAQIWSAGVFVGKTLTDIVGKNWRRGSLEYAVDFMPVFETYGDQRIHGWGFDPVILRWNSAHHTSRIAPYIELSGGAVITSANLPPGDTSSFNFMAKGGGGIYVRTQKRQWLDFACRWSHISNANLGNYNPEFNGVQLSIAYHWGFK